MAINPAHYERSAYDAEEYCRCTRCGELVHRSELLPGEGCACCADTCVHCGTRTGIAHDLDGNWSCELCGPVAIAYELAESRVAR